jgi:hypothetical protein
MSVALSPVVEGPTETHQSNLTSLSDSTQQTFVFAKPQPELGSFDPALTAYYFNRKHILLYRFIGDITNTHRHRGDNKYRLSTDNRHTQSFRQQSNRSIN